MFLTPIWQEFCERIYDDRHTSIKMNNVNMQHTYVETWFIFVKMQQMQYNSVNMEPIF